MKLQIQVTRGKWKTAGICLLLFYIVLLNIWRFEHISPFVRTWDQVDFSLALSRFDLFAMQPHFPGYPYFVLGGMLIGNWIDNPARALSAFNVILIFSSVFPTYFLFRSRLTVLASLLGTAAVQSLAYISLNATEPMSEAAAVAMLWWFFWTIHLALKKKSLFYTILPLFAYSLVLGIRLSYLLFGAAIVLLWIVKRKQFSSWNAYFYFIGWQTALAVFFQLIWVAALVASEGGIASFLNLAFGFSQGHFEDWGGAVTATSLPFWNRVWQLVTMNWLWAGLSASFAFSAVVLAVLIVFAFKELLGGKRRLTILEIVLSLTLGCYFLWVLFAQNIEKPRHILPLTGPFLFLVLYFLFASKKRYLVKILIVICFIGGQSYQGYTLIEEKMETTPTVYQLADYLKNQGSRPFVVYTWEETRILEYLEVPFRHKQIFTYDYFKEDISHYKGYTIYLTDHVVNGFADQGIDIHGKVKKIAEFDSNPLFDPVYHKITVYKFTGE
ncbi:hypothetical protein [Pseudalkalibacillus caeni]|uniref:Glycosyltransferase RgtA/B/C/D-like domain-containing protein n=1 Tax=Exobacillus caeni TaxID=2574798 RepID=A0A5R9F9K2_9BACL|nr:hypothetical protein [Pseudalkalibacillus caeni]TLS39189.1 hypothetical protein FCL54_02435 [Pseudalkalibacillus caeni]